MMLSELRVLTIPASPPKKCKSCVGCKKTRHLTQFGKDKNQPDGLNKYCTDCTDAFAELQTQKKRAGQQEEWQDSITKLYAS